MAKRDKHKQRAVRTGRSDTAHSWTVKRYTRQDAETMMCLLDAWRDIEEEDQRKHNSIIAAHKAMGGHDPDPPESFFLKFRSEWGSFDLRHTLEQLCHQADEVWKALGEHESGLTYDWEFCPLFLRVAVDWETRDGNCEVKLYPDAVTRMKAHMAVQERFGRSAA